MLEPDAYTRELDELWEVFRGVIGDEVRLVGSCAYCWQPVLFTAENGGRCPCGRTVVRAEFIHMGVVLAEALGRPMARVGCAHQGPGGGIRDERGAPMESNDTERDETVDVTTPGGTEVQTESTPSESQPEPDAPAEGGGEGEQSEPEQG